MQSSNIHSGNSVFFFPPAYALSQCPLSAYIYSNEVMFGKTIHNCQTWSCVLVKQYFNPLTENKQMPL